jgi:hypothetical protein
MSQRSSWDAGFAMHIQSADLHLRNTPCSQFPVSVHSICAKQIKSGAREYCNEQTCFRVSFSLEHYRGL